MTNRTKTIEVLDKYFEEKGRVLTAQEYIREEDTPIRYQQVRLMFGSWPRMEKIMLARREAGDPITDVDKVIAERNASVAAVEAQWKEASENQEKKVVREAEAQLVAEKLARNAATPEGANANKIAIGGPLPSEQPRFELRGATVNIDPKTGERTVTDPEPELIDVNAVDGDAEVGDTFRTVMAKVEKAKSTGVDVGHATDGGSSGSASIATANALAGTETEVSGETVSDVTAPVKDTSAETKAPSPARTTSTKK